MTKSISKSEGFVACHKMHPPLEVKPGKFVYGGSCIHPAIDDADVYVGLDAGMRFSERSFPWTPGFEVLYEIRNGEVPQHPENFKKLVDWILEQLDAGSKVHCGCIAGHGRTGMLLSALRRTGMDDVNAIATVRAEYCKKAVETEKQVRFLEEHFGITPLEPSYGWKKNQTERWLDGAVNEKKNKTYDMNAREKRDAFGTYTSSSSNAGLPFAKTSTSSQGYTRQANAAPSSWDNYGHGKKEIRAYPMMGVSIWQK